MLPPAKNIINYKSLRSLVNQFLFAQTRMRDATINLNDKKNALISFLNEQGKEEISLTIQGKPVIISNRKVQKFILKDNAASILRRTLPPDLISLVVFEKDFVAIDVLIKLTESKTVDDSIVNSLYDITEDTLFDVYPKKDGRTPC